MSWWRDEVVEELMKGIGWCFVACLVGILAACEGEDEDEFSYGDEPDLVEDAGDVEDAGPDTFEPAVLPEEPFCLGDTLPVLVGDPVNRSYPPPRFFGSCTEDGLMRVTSNGIPPFPFEQVTNESLRPQNHQWNIPLEPELSGSFEELEHNKVIGFALNGLPFHSAEESEGPGPARDPLGDLEGDDFEQLSIDFCAGHTGVPGIYHHHALPENCVILGYSAESSFRSPLLGYALDGFPIYGPRVCVNHPDCDSEDDFAEVKSSWEKADDGVGDWLGYRFVPRDDEAYLDRCNGRIGPDGTYRYHATTEFPYTLGCFRGTPTEPLNLRDPSNGMPSEGGNNGPSQGEPTVCVSDEDCLDARCLAGEEWDCVCHSLPDRDMKICVQECEFDEDCSGISGEEFECIEGGCLRARG